MHGVKKSWLDSVTGHGTIAIAPLEWLPLEFLCFHMRPIDAAEIFNILDDDNPLNCAALIWHQVAKNGCGWIARFNGRPAACMGVIENFPGNWQVFSFGTENYHRVLVAFKPKLDKMIGFARERGMHRLECRSLISHVDAHRCTRFIGLQAEAVLKQYGKDASDYVLFSRTWPKKEPPEGGPSGT